jgi:hypothetical protein
VLDLLDEFDAVNTLEIYLYNRRTAVADLTLNSTTANVASRHTLVENCSFITQNETKLENVGAAIPGEGSIHVGIAQATYKNCFSNHRGFRGDYTCDIHFRLEDCKCPFYGFFGDATHNAGTYASPTITGCEFTGEAYRCVGGVASFGGCALFGCNASIDAYMEDCIGGDNSYFLGRTCAATIVRCNGGLNCFAGTAGATGGAAKPVFSGIGNNLMVQGGNSCGRGNEGSILSECTGSVNNLFIVDEDQKTVAITTDMYVNTTYSGYTFTNTGAAAAINVTITDLRVGDKITVIRTDATAGKDVLVQFNVSGSITNAAGTTGNYALTEDDNIVMIELTCIGDSNALAVTGSTGTWTIDTM